MMPIAWPRNPAVTVPATVAAPSTAPSAPNTRPRWLSAVARWSKVKPPASVSAPGTPTTTMHTTAGQTAT